ncbi:MAG TPA: hypothetical protein VMW76_00655 [Bacteroidales bacterium]|nr:hypothetical protein [Bacteroidales bacterium]
MISVHNIRTVARYEAKTLRRSWLFRLFSIGTLFILILFNIGMFSPVGDEDWESVSIASTLPHMNLYLINIAQALIIVFLASDFLKRDKKLDTNEVLYTRPMSNLEYITGKSLGILRLFLGLNLLILLVCLIINIIARNTSVDFASYITHLLIISLPTLIFSLGFAYIMMSVVRNQSITFLLLLGFAALNMFYLYFRAGSVFDYMLFGMPVFKSQMIGYVDMDTIIAHRMMYTLSGLSFILLTVLIFKRLPQSKAHKTISIALLIIFASGAGYSGFYFYNNYKQEQNLKAATLELNSRFENKLFLSVSDAEIILRHSGKMITATSELTCINSHDEQVEEVVFSLNPGLIVTSMLINDDQVPFNREGHILTAASPVEPGERIKVTVTYSGGMSEAFCYPWYNSNIKDDSYSIGPLQINQKQLLLEEDYLLLTAEACWYPVAGLNYYPSNPARIKVDFTNYTLKVWPAENLVAVAQGVKSQENGYSVFTNETPLTGLSLIEGKYNSATIKVDSIDYTAFYFEDHDYYNRDLNEIADTLSSLISNVMTELETNFSTNYPFRRLTLVEVPIQFRSIPKKNTQTFADVQPSLILLPEKLATINSAGFYRSIKSQKRRMERSNQVTTDRELQVRAFNQFVRNTFISSNEFNFRRGSAIAEPGRHLLGPSFYFFKNNFYSNDYPVINAVFETHLQKVSNPGNMARGFLGGLSENDKANTILKDLSLKELLSLDPSNDTLRIVLTVKGDYLFNLIRSQAGIDDFNNWFVKYVEENKFRNIEIGEFSSAIEQKFNFSIMPFLPDWFEGKDQPGFYFTDIKATDIVINNRTRYKVSFVVSNPLDAPGLFNVSFRTGGMGPGGGRGSGGMQVTISTSGGSSGNISAFGMAGRGMQPNQVDRIVKVDGNQAKRINIILDAQPRAMMINTLYSVNNPGELTLPIQEITKERNVSESEEDEILDRIPPLSEENEIIVDNEDPGFRIFQPESSGKLKTWLNISRQDGNDYREMFSWWAPEYWQKTVQSNYYGKFIKSAVYTKAGAGERYISWTAKITEPGYYDVYTYISMQGGNRMMMDGGPGGVQGGGRDRSRITMRDIHFNVYHDDGNEDITLEYDNTENGWNLLGSYYLSPDSATVIMTNASTGRTVTGDAIKWVQQNSFK